MPFPRAAGVLLHPTSLPSPAGIGDLGPEAHRFAGWCAEAGLRLWQLLPLGPTGFGDSPYQCFSAFAGNPLLLHVPGFAGDFPAHTVDFGGVIPAKRAALDAWLDTLPADGALEAFVAREAHWLPDYALFMALKAAHGGAPWTAWEPGAAHRDPAALARWREALRPAITRVCKEQQQFAAQFEALRAHCHALGVRLMGDLPIYVAHDSADVWANRDLFHLHPDGSRAWQAGVPPDYFSATGQLWGNPLYDWERLAATGYAWWIARARAAFRHFDLVRLDHFRGFEAYWAVPGDHATAMHGRWQPGPGGALFEALTAALGPLPIVAENLGMITPAVEALRERFGYPGMAILQFAFDGQDSTFLPHRHVRDLVVYTGTHDNDTAVGWWRSGGAGDSTRPPEAVAREKAFARRYLATDGHEIHWTLIRTALASVADTVLLPLQDILGLGTEARMNLPGRQQGNWGFRFTWDALPPALTARLRALTATYER
jgi:4-alpha-glucanotransferase